jgi:uncharacterized protein (DUF2126 family)
MVDGRHTGTGGGNHFVLGGATPNRFALPAPARPAAQPGRLLAQPSVAVLPVLRPVHRPDQPGAARRRGAQRLGVRNGDRLREIPEGRADSVPPWLIDRMLRNLLIDVTGNTHRAEFCIDKLYSPDGPTGRLGLLEMRAFEMPPHARMSLAQQLLLRALIARFWQAPYARRAWCAGAPSCTTASCCRISCGQDFNDVIEDLRRPAIRFEGEWFAPHFEFRFPKIGEFPRNGIEWNCAARSSPGT